MKKTTKRVTISCVIMIAIAVIAIVGYNVYRRPATFRHLTNKSLDEQQVNELKDTMLAKDDKKILVAYFSYSGTTKNVATALSEKTGADLFEIAPQKSYDLNGKLIIPFCTSGGSDIDETMATFLDSCDGLAVYGEKRIAGVGEIDNWLQELGITVTDDATVDTSQSVEFEKIEIEIYPFSQSASMDTEQFDDSILFIGIY